MAHDVFVSHSVKDKLVANAIVARLEADSVRCWVAPRDVVPGADWGESIVDAIEASRIMILIFSRNANASPQIKREVERAVDKGVYIIPFRVDDIEPTKSLEYFISTAQWMDAFPPPLERHLETLAKTVKAILAGAPPLPREPEPPSPPAPSPSTNSGRWIAIAAGLLLVGLGSWYVASHRHTTLAPAQEIAATTPSATVAQPRTTISEKNEESTAAAKEAQERAKHEADLQAQLAAAQERLKQMQERTPEPQAETTPNQSGPWLFPDSSSRYLSPNELAGLSADQLWQARNEIYARNGYRFSSPKGLAFARSLGSYYQGVDPDDDRVFNHMNPFEKANVILIKSVEQP
jgi:TIR domain/YARHG domain